MKYLKKCGMSIFTMKQFIEKWRKKFNVRIAILTFEDIEVTLSNNQYISNFKKKVSFSVFLLQTKLKRIYLNHKWKVEIK